MNHGPKNLGSSSIAGLASRIDQDGYAVIENFLPAAELEKAQDFVRQAVADNGGEYVGFSGRENLGGTFLEGLATDPDFMDLCRRIYTSGTGSEAPEVEFYQVLRCLSGTQASGHSMRFHFDSYVLTALLPIIIPVRGKKGNLIIVSRKRPIRRSYVANLVDKALVDNRLSQALLRSTYKHGLMRTISLELRPGNLYFFWGYRSLHTNEPCDAAEIRSTALLHYADPHIASRVKHMVRASGLRSSKFSGARGRALEIRPRLGQILRRLLS